MNEALARELHANHKHQTKYFTKLENELDNIYLNTGQLDHLVEIDLSQNKRLGRVRDLFLVGCWTGLRFSDFNNICKKDIQGDFLNIKTQKTNKAVIIPIHPTIEEVIKRYNGVTENSLPPAISNVKMNLYLKELGEIAGFNEIRQVKETKGGNTIVHNRPLYGLITTHTARRSFATNMYLMGVPSITIMAITGHLTETTFLKYIKVTPKEHAVKLKEIWSRFILKVV